MQRKTHLFYLDGPDSKFLTFSNYAEYLTGNYLSSNHKMFPSKFLCVYIPSLKLANEENSDQFEDADRDDSYEDCQTRTEFIRDYLVGYYENKLAAIRDYCVKNNKVSEKEISPLGYLLDTLSKVDPDYQISYVGEISEQDYNGTYTDSICIIDGNDLKTGVPIYADNQLVDEYYSVKIQNPRYLYGWKSEILPKMYKDEQEREIPEESSNEQFNQESEIPEESSTEQFNQLTDELESSKDPELFYFYPLYDTGYYSNDNSDLECLYNVSPRIIDLELGPKEDDTDFSPDEIKFNCVIPLFDIVEINSLTNDSSIDVKNDTSEPNTNISLDYVTNIPYGIWIADQNIVLKRDTISQQFPMWTLVVSMQFKSLPYIQSPNYNIYNQVENGDDVNSKSPVANEFATFAQILSRQNDIINKFNQTIITFNKLENNLINLTNSVNKLENKVNSITNLSSLDVLQRDILNFKADLTNDYESFKEYITDNLMKAIHWNPRESK